VEDFGTGRHFSKGGMFMVGFMSGVLVAAAVLAVTAGYVIKHPQAVLNKAVNLGAKQIVQRTLETAPKEYIGQKQDEIASSAQKFSKAFSENRISPADVQLLSAHLFGMLADQKITREEIDSMLKLVNGFTR
jgi:hypothetical protein